MDLIGLVLGLIVEPVSWSIAVIIILILWIAKGGLVPRSQVDALVEGHVKIEDNQKEIIAMIREDRDRQLDALRAERDAWRTTAEEANGVSRSVRSQNEELIKRLGVLDHLLNSLRSATGIGEDEGGGKDV